MNKVINKFLLAGDKFMPEMHLKQPRFDLNLNVQAIRVIFIEKNSIKLVFNTILPMLIIKI